jgi:hypothetical protein
MCSWIDDVKSKRLQIGWIVTEDIKRTMDPSTDLQQAIIQNK